MASSHLEQGTPSKDDVMDGTPARTTTRMLAPSRSLSHRARCLMTDLYSRELGSARVPSRRAFLQSLHCDTAHNEHDIFSTTDLVPPFCVQFCPIKGQEHLLAVADEDGTVSLIDSNKSRMLQTGSERVLWRAHHNAIFTIQWISGRSAMLTGSGDQSCRLWDVNTKQELLTFRGHSGSVKTIACSPFEPSVFSSGARDGNVLIWDMRSGTAPVGRVDDAHMPPSTKRKRWHPHSVSSVLLLASHEHALVSGGASDGTVKLWDCRSLTSALSSSSNRSRGKFTRKPTPLQQLMPTITCTSRLHGIVSLALDQTNGRLAVSSTDHSVFVYDSRWAYASQRPQLTDVTCLRGHLCESFYVKSAFSPDGRFLVHGSSDKSAYIWDVDRPRLPPLILIGHTQEVTGVAWNPTEFGTLATASDDQTVRIWKVDRERGQVESAPTTATPEGLSSVAANESMEPVPVDRVHSLNNLAAPASMTAAHRAQAVNAIPATPTTGRQEIVASVTSARSMPSRSSDLRNYFSRIDANVTERCADQSPAQPSSSISAADPPETFNSTP